MQLRVERTEEAKKLNIALPSYQHEGDAGLDLRAAKECIIKKGTRQTVPTGVKIAVPSGYFGFIKDRSGLASKHGIHTLAGVVDCGYRGEVAVVLHNLSDEDFTVEAGMRIAQLLIVPVSRVEVIEQSLDETSRGANGWGSTGHK